MISLLKPSPNPVFLRSLFLFGFLEYFTQLHAFALHLRQAATLLKRNSGSVVFLWNLRNFSENLFYRTHLGDRLCSEVFHILAESSYEGTLNPVESVKFDVNFLKLSWFLWSLNWGPAFMSVSFPVPKLKPY